MRNKSSNKYILFLSSFFVVLAFIALVVFIVQKARSPKTISVPERELVTNNKLLTPDAPYIQNDYITSRNTKDNWSEEEIQKWFTSPQTNELNDLHHANNKTVSDILGAAP